MNEDFSTKWERQYRRVPMIPRGNLFDETADHTT
jgi:hypothetical protein